MPKYDYAYSLQVWSQLFIFITYLLCRNQVLRVYTEKEDELKWLMQLEEETGGYVSM